jgi:hypothetical protein
MVFARLVANALPAGAHGALVAILLVGIANPDLGAAPGALVRLAAIFAPVHAAAAAIVWAVLYAALRYFASHPLRLGWFDLRYVMGFHVAHGALCAASAWTTLSAYRRSLSEASADRVAGLCAAVTLAWLAAAVVAVLPRVRRVAAAQRSCAALALLAPLAALLPGSDGGGSGAIAAGTRPPAPPPARRVLLLNFDGADLETLLTLQAEGKLPAFARLLQEGSYGKLRSIQPCAAAVTRATLLTGRLPYRHGVRSAEARRVGRGDPWIDIVPAGLQFDRLLAPFLERRDRTAGDIRTLAVHEIARRTGGRGEAAGWDIDPDRRPRPAPPWTGPWPAWLADALDLEGPGGDDPLAREVVGELEAARTADAAVAGEFDRFAAETRPGVAAASFPGLDRLAHLFLESARPRDFAAPRERGAALRGRALEAHYRFLDGIVARALDAAAADAVVVVTSTHGMDPGPLARRLLRGSARMLRPSGTHARAPDGLLIVRGPGVERGHRLGKGALADVAPTVLYALGLPAARDLDGTILAGVFRPAYTFDHPVTVIGSYEAAR